MEMWNLFKTLFAISNIPFDTPYSVCHSCKEDSKPPSVYGIMCAVIFQKLIDIAQRFQDDGLFFFWGPQPHLVIFSEDAVKIFSNEPAALDKSHKYGILRDSLGTGLLTSNAEIWRKHRKLLNPAFHVGMLKSKMSIFNENAEILVKKLEVAMNSSSVDILEYLKPCTFGVMCESVMGLNVSNPEDQKEINYILQIVKDLSELIVYRFTHPWLHFKFMLNFVPSGRKYLKMYEDCHNFSQKIILDMKLSIESLKASGKSRDGHPEDDKETRKSFARILLEHHLDDPSFTICKTKSLLFWLLLIQSVPGSISNITNGGYDSTSHSLMWCFYMLGLYPDVQDQAYNEVGTISEKHINYEDLHKLKYLDCVIKETLRLYPTVPIYARCINKDVQCGKYLVPKGTDIVFFPYMLHRNPDVYPDPEKFDPERFREDNLSKRTSIYTPFSEGLRDCIGRRFAMMEMKVIIAYILRHFRITSLDREEDLDLCWEILLAPSRPLQFKLIPRK